MVAGHPGKVEAATPAGLQRQRTPEENLVQPGGGRKGRVGQNGVLVAGRMVGGAAEAEGLGEERGQPRPPVVEIPRHQTGGAGIEGGELLAAHQDPHLPGPLLEGKPQMQIENRQRAGWIAGQGQLGEEAAAPFAVLDGQVDIAGAEYGIAAQGGVAVHPLLEPDVEAQGVVRIAEPLGQHLGQVQFPGAGHPDIHLLKQNEIGVVVGDDLGDALGQEAAVNTDGPVDVVRKNPKFHDGLPPLLPHYRPTAFRTQPFPAPQRSPSSGLTTPRPPRLRTWV